MISVVKVIAYIFAMIIGGSIGAIAGFYGTAY